MDEREFTIRRARETDMAEIYSIEIESFVSPWSMKSLQNELSTAFSHFIIAETAGKIAGYAVAWEVAGEIQLNHIAVREEFRRRGAGRALMDFFEAHFKARGAQKILLEVRSRNSTARVFYRALGFRENGIRNNYYQDDDAILMEKDI